MNLTVNSYSTRPLYETMKNRLAYAPEKDLSGKLAKASANIFEWDRILKKPDFRLKKQSHPLYGYTTDNLDSFVKRNPAMAEKLYEMKNENGNHRFDTFEVPKILDVYEDYPEAVEKLMEMKDENGNYKLNAHEICAMADLYAGRPDKVKEYLNKHTSYDTDRLRTRMAHHKAVDKLSTIIKENNLRGIDPIKLAEAYTRNPELLDRLLNLKIFNDNTVILVIEAKYNKYPESTLENLKTLEVRCKNIDAKDYIYLDYYYKKLVDPTPIYS